MIATLVGLRRDGAGMHLSHVTALGAGGKDRALGDDQARRADGRDDRHRDQARVGATHRLWKIQLTTTLPIRPRMTSHPARSFLAA